MMHVDAMTTRRRRELETKQTWRRVTVGIHSGLLSSSQSKLQPRGCSESTGGSELGSDGGTNVTNIVSKCTV
jgi:hypothetical protein